MDILRSLALVSALAFASAAAHASTITYNLSGVTSAGSVTGTVSIDTATSLVTSANLTFNDPTLGSPVFNSLGSQAAYNGLSQDYIAAPSSGPVNYGGQLALFFNTASLGAGSAGICTSAAVCGTQGVEPSSITVYSTQGNQTFNLTSGTLSTQTQLQTVPSAATPEPASLLLLGTGIFGCALLIVYRAARQKGLPPSTPAG